MSKRLTRFIGAGPKLSTLCERGSSRGKNFHDWRLRPLRANPERETELCHDYHKPRVRGDSAPSRSPQLNGRLRYSARPPHRPATHRPVERTIPSSSRQQWPPDQPETMPVRQRMHCHCHSTLGHVTPGVMRLSRWRSDRGGEPVHGGRKDARPSARQIDFCRVTMDKYQRITESRPLRCRTWPGQGGNVTPPSSLEGLRSPSARSSRCATPVQAWGPAPSHPVRRLRDGQNRTFFQLPTEVAGVAPRASATVAERSRGTAPPRRRRRESRSPSRNCVHPGKGTWPRASCSAASRQTWGDLRSEDR